MQRRRNLISHLQSPILWLQILLPPSFQHLHRLKEWPQKEISSCKLQQWIHQQRPLVRSRVRKSQPALKHPEHRARSRALVIVAHGGDSRAGFPRIILFPAAVPDLVVDAAQTIAVGFPALDTPAVNVGPECELAVAWFPDADTVGVGEWLGGGD